MTTSCEILGDSEFKKYIVFSKIYFQKQDRSTFIWYSMKEIVWFCSKPRRKENIISVSHDEYSLKWFKISTVLVYFVLCPQYWNLYSDRGNILQVTSPRAKGKGDYSNSSVWNYFFFLMCSPSILLHFLLLCLLHYNFSLPDSCVTFRTCHGPFRSNIFNDLLLTHFVWCLCMCLAWIPETLFDRTHPPDFMSLTVADTPESFIILGYRYLNSQIPFRDKVSIMSLHRHLWENIGSC